MQIQAVLSEPAVRIRAGILSRTDLLPLAIIIGIAVMTLILEQWIPLRWTIPAYKFIWPAGICLAVAVFYSMVRPNRVFQEISGYLGFWVFFPVLATKISYFAACVGMPLRDGLFNAADAAMGFHWADWVLFIARYPALVTLLGFVFGSLHWQPLLTVPILALWGPRGSKAQLLTSVLFAILFSLAIFMLLPS